MMVSHDNVLVQNGRVEKKLTAQSIHIRCLTPLHEAIACIMLWWALTVLRNLKCPFSHYVARYAISRACRQPFANRHSHQ